MTLTFEGIRERRFFNLFRRNKIICETLSTPGEIQENLDWALKNKVSVEVFSESSPDRFKAAIVGLDHSSLDSYILLQAMGAKEAASVLLKKDSLVLEYHSSRGGCFVSRSIALSELHPESGEFRAGYPPSIDYYHDFYAVRVKSTGGDPVQVDVEEQRGVVVNISSKGLRFTCNEMLEKGALFKDFQVDLPGYGMIEVSAVVRHIQSSIDNPVWRYLCGVEFTEIKPRYRKRLNHYLTRMLKE
jgi:hypothetical protein